MEHDRRTSDQARTVGDCERRSDAHDKRLETYRATVLRANCWAIGILLMTVVVPGIANAVHQAKLNGKMQIQIENLKEDIVEIKVDITIIKDDVKDVLVLVRKNGG